MVPARPFKLPAPAGLTTTVTAKRTATVSSHAFMTKLLFVPGSHQTGEGRSVGARGFSEATGPILDQPSDGAQRDLSTRREAEEHDQQSGGARSLYDLIRPQQQRRRDPEAGGLFGIHVFHLFEIRWVVHRQVT